MQDNIHLKKSIEIVQNVLIKNMQEGESIRKDLEAKGILGLNFMSSPGSGKTSILEALAELNEFKFSVIEGDLQTENDANRLRKKGIEAAQIQTGSACHLDAFMIANALKELSLKDSKVCVVENVGNLVCPASYDVGTHFNVVLLSVTEGDDKVEKYPVMFKRADLIIVSKIDLLEYFDFDLNNVYEAARRLNPAIKLISASSKSKEGIKELANWIKERANELFNNQKEC